MFVNSEGSVGKLTSWSVTVAQILAENQGASRLEIKDNCGS
jgi:hypothetical protein